MANGKTRSERMLERAGRLRSRGRGPQGAYMADLLEKSAQDPMAAKMTAQERGGMALEAGAAAGAASAPAMQQLAEAGMMGDQQALAGAATQIQQGATQGAYQGAMAAEQADQQRVQTAKAEKQQAQQDAIAEQVRKRQQVMSDISAGLEIGMQVASLVGAPGFNIIKNIAQIGEEKDTMEDTLAGGIPSQTKYGVPSSKKVSTTGTRAAFSYDPRGAFS
jgi:hypothetical protein